MAETASTMLALGTQAPDFQLLDTITNKIVSLNELKSDKATVIMFLCNHCPYVKLILPKLVDLAQNYQKKDIAFIAINSNDVEKYPDDSPDNMKNIAEQQHFNFSYLFDETQDVARAYHAACTPDFYIFDNQLKCVYRGRFDNATPNNQQSVTGNDLSNALDAILEGKSVDANQQASLGCNIKWKK